jgi:hypothetical protein
MRRPRLLREAKSSSSSAAKSTVAAAAFSSPLDSMALPFSSSAARALAPDTSIRHASAELVATHHVFFVM